MTRLRSIALGVLLATATAALGSGATPAVELLLNKARALEGRGRTDLAAQVWEHVLLSDPNQQDALAALAGYATQNGQAGEARKYLERLRKVNPSNPGIAGLEAQKRITQSDSRLREASRLAASQQYEAAMKIFRDVFGTRPPPGVWALSYYETESATPGGWDEALSGLRELHRTYPNAENYTLLLGKLYTYRPGTREAGLHLLEGIPENSVLASKARQAWRQALVWSGSDPSVAGSLKLFLARYKDPELQTALDRAKAPVSKEPVEGKAGMLRGRAEKAGFAALKANHLAEAETLFQTALQEAADSPGALSGIGFIRMKQQDFEAAVTYLEKARAAAPANKQVMEALNTSHFWKAMREAAAYQQDKQLANAVDAFSRAIQMRPNSIEAKLGLAGAYAESGKADAAIRIYSVLIKVQPRNADIWRGLVGACRQSGTAADALSVIRTIPTDVQTELKKNVDYLIALASISDSAGLAGDAQKYLDQAINLAQTKNAKLSIDVQLEFGGLLLKMGQSTKAASLFELVTQSQPSNMEAWQGLLSALLQNPDNTAGASSQLERMPRDLYDKAIQQPPFIRLVASIYSGMKRYDLAETLLMKSLSLERESAGEVSAATQLQLADLWAHTAQPGKANTVLSHLRSTHPELPDVWRAWIASLHALDQDPDALSQIQVIPPDVKRTLLTDSGYIATQASVYLRTGHTDEALRSVRERISQLEMSGRPVPPALANELAWVLLDRPGDSKELYSLLQAEDTRTDTTADQKQELAQIWSIWIRRRAQAEIAGGDLAKGVLLLRTGSRFLPNDRAIRSDLGGNLLKKGDSRGALDVYRNWGMKDALASDYLGAVGAAMAIKDRPLADQWLSKALQQYPEDPKLLNLAARQAESAGDYKKAEVYLRAAKTTLAKQDRRAREKGSNAPGSGKADPSNVVPDLGHLLVDGDVSEAAPSAAIGMNQRSRNSVDPISFEDLGYTNTASGSADSPYHATTVRVAQVAKLASSQANSAAASKSDDTEFLRLLGSSEKDSPSVSEARRLDGGSGNDEPLMEPAVVASTLADAPPKTLAEEIDDQIEAINSRNTPYFGGDAAIQRRTGQAGYDKLTTETSSFEATTSFHDQVRLSLIARPVFLDSGTPEGTSTLRFGLLPVGAAPAAQSQSGVGAEVQLSTRNLGLLFGANPQNFLVKNWVGGFRFRPGGGPLSFVFTRDSLKDTMLSYAGARDPVTNTVWGGVVADGGQINGNWGSSVSGFYFNAGYQLITGKQVANNSRIDGSGGTYWKLLTRPEGSLTVGLNFSAMHYDKNLRYFTLGQGGYFSPQEYFLFNVPIRWTGTWRRQIQYSVSGSIGAQHFSEDESPYFPAVLSLQGTNGLYYPSHTDTGPNFSLDARAIYQFSPNWQMGMYFSANNARDYTAETAGVYVRYLIRPKPISEELNLPSLPDWKGAQPFSLP